MLLPASLHISATLGRAFMSIENAQLMSNLPFQLFQFVFEINKTSVCNTCALETVYSCTATAVLLFATLHVNFLSQ